MNEQQRKRQTRGIVLMEAAFIVGSGACLTLIVILAMLVFGV
jgi:hypothetical protein